MAKKTTKGPFPIAVPGFTSPRPGSDLVQLFFSNSRLAADIASVIGVLNPQWVTTSRRMQMRNDPDVAFALMIQRAPIINMEWSIESEDPVIKAFIEHVMKKVYRQMATGLSNAIPLGRQLCEMVWGAAPLTLTITDEFKGTSSEESIPMAWLPTEFKAIDPRSYNFLVDVDKDDWFGVEQIYQGKLPAKIQGVPREKLVFWSFCREDVFGRLEGWPLCDKMYEGWWYKNALRFIRNRYMQKKAHPPTKAKAGPEITIDGKKQNGFTYMANQALALEGGGVVVFPSAVDKDGNPLFDMEFMKDDKRGDMIQQAIEAEKTEILRGGLVTDRAATSGRGGSGGGQQRGGLAESKQHAEVMHESQECFIDEYAEDVVQPQVIDRTVLFNFGEEALKNSKTRLVTSGISSSLQQIYADLISAIIDAEKAALNGEPIRLWERIDAPNILKALQIPLRPAAELEELAQQREADKKAAQDQLAQGGAAGAGGGALGLQDPQLEKAVRDRLSKAGASRPKPPK